MYVVCTLHSVVCFVCVLRYGELLSNVNIVRLIHIVSLVLTPKCPLMDENRELSLQLCDADGEFASVLWHIQTYQSRNTLKVWLKSTQITTQ